ncbi:MAG TPA: GxxExxY protein, partial [Chthoniobacteraceae bacterium]|nr:GxxExxY protein [Chthoniobacteraceae bacterium]
MAISLPHPDKLLFREITEAVIGAAFAVHRELGYGFLEKVYQRALQVELLKSGHSAELEFPIAVKYRGVIVGEYFADLLVDGKV